MENQNNQLQTQSNKLGSESKVKQSRKTRRVRMMSEKAKFPVIPVRGLWDQASVEERAQAKQVAQVIMEYWMGNLTKIEATEKLSLRPVRFWQMSNQAVAGMTAGLLTQPRYRKGAFLASDEVLALRKQVKELEFKVSTQQKLIEILKSLPGRMERAQGGISRDASTENKSGLQRGNKKKNRSKSDSGTTREPEDNSAGFKCDDSHAEVLAQASGDEADSKPART